MTWWWNEDDGDCQHMHCEREADLTAEIGARLRDRTRDPPTYESELCEEHYEELRETWGLIWRADS